MALLTADELIASARGCGVPDGLIDGIVLYVTHGYRPGSFLTAVLENDLMGAMRSGDLISRASLFVIFGLVYNALPTACHGSAKKVAAWMAAGGMRQFETDKAGV